MASFLLLEIRSCMADVFSKKKRSEVMSLIRSRDTKLERIIFQALRKRKIYFQKHYSRAPGSPDIAIPSLKKAVFIDGDFWHGRNFAKIKRRLPKKYWVGKIGSNIKRDKRNKAMLKKAGWKVLRVWEHEIKKNPKKAVGKVEKFLKKP